MKKIIALTFTIFILFSFFGCSSDNKPSKAYINYNLDTEPSSLDPQIASDISAKIVITNIFEGLTKIDADGNAIPALAESWSANNDNTSFTFNLRQDAVWSDKNKTSVTAQDFIFALKRAVSPDTDSELAESLYCIKNASLINSKLSDINSLGVYTPDDYTLKIELEYSYDDLPVLMASTVAMPCNENFFNSCNGQYGLEGNTIISNGSFNLTNIYSWIHSTSISLSRNTNYKGSHTAVPAGINFTIGSSYANTVTAIQNGTIDISLIDSENLSAAKSNNMNLVSFKNITWGFCFNMNNETFENINIRTGLLSALDRNYIIKNIPESYTKASDIIMPAITIAGEYYRNVAGDNFGLPQSDNSLSLIASGLKQLNLDSIPAITIICVDTPACRSIVSNAIELLNKNLGVYFNMEALSSDDFNSKISLSNYQMALIPLTAKNDSPFDLLSAFKSNSKSNNIGFKDAYYDNLLNENSIALGLNSLPYYIEAEKYLNNNAIFYPVCYQEKYYASNANVSDVIIYPFNGGIDFSSCTKISK